MTRLRRVVDGDITYNRLPDTVPIMRLDSSGAFAFEGFMSPSVGLQNETIQFGGYDHVAVK